MYEPYGAERTRPCTSISLSLPGRLQYFTFIEVIVFSSFSIKLLLSLLVVIATRVVIFADENSAVRSYTPPHEPRLFFYDDGRHASPLYQFAPPLTPEDFVFTVDQLVGTGIDTLIYSVGLEGGVVQFDSRFGQKWGENVDVWTHEIFYRASRNLHQLIRDGHDPLQLICDRCREKGIWFLPSLPVCITGTDRAKWGGLGRTSDFAYRSELQVGRDKDPRADEIGRFFKEYRLNFTNAEVREERFRLFAELLTRYESHGIELDLSIDNEFGPMCRFDQVEQLAPLLTQWIRDLRQVARQAEREQGQRKRIYVRIPAASKDVWRKLGFEVSTWIDQGLVDGLICLTTNRIPNTPMLDQDLDLAAALKVAEGSDVRVLAGFEGPLGTVQEKEATPPMIWAAAANAFADGADGFGICMGTWVPDGWPWTEGQYTTLRVLGHPNLLATADKTYRALSRMRGEPVGLFRPVRTVLPSQLVEGESLELKLKIADDVARRHGEGKLECVRLRVYLTNFELGLDAVRVQWNGRDLPESLLEPSDLHFRLVKQGLAGPSGYVLDFDLTPEFFPVQGENRLKVTLVQRDPKLNQPVDFYDVHCAIKYRAHRHFQRVPVEY
jgi:hypothetical protein